MISTIRFEENNFSLTFFVVPWGVAQARDLVGLYPGAGSGKICRKKDKKGIKIQSYLLFFTRK